MSIGERIKEARIDSGIGQTELADRVGISKQSLYKYENDIITNIPSDKVEAIARVLHTTPAYLMGWDTPQPSAARYFRVPVLGSVHAGCGRTIWKSESLDILGKALNIKAFYMAQSGTKRDKEGQNHATF